MKWKRNAEKNERNSREIIDGFKKKMELSQGNWMVIFRKMEVGKKKAVLIVVFKAHIVDIWRKQNCYLITGGYSSLIEEFTDDNQVFTENLLSSRCV